MVSSPATRQPGAPPCPESGIGATRFGSQPVTLMVGYYWNETRPDGGADSQIRIQVNCLWPSKG